MINRSMAALITMLPGAREVAGTVSAKGASGTWVSVGGGGGQNVNMVVDGIDNKEDHCGGASMSYSLEGIQEFQVFKSGARAEFGRGTASILVATKSGDEPIVRVGVRLLPQPGHGRDRLLLEAGERRRRRTAVQAIAGRRVDRRPDRQGQDVLLRFDSSSSSRTSSCRGRPA